MKLVCLRTTSNNFPIICHESKTTKVTKDKRCLKTRLFGLVFIQLSTALPVPMRTSRSNSFRRTVSKDARRRGWSFEVSPHRRNGSLKIHSEDEMHVNQLFLLGNLQFTVVTVFFIGDGYAEFRQNSFGLMFAWGFSRFSRVIWMLLYTATSWPTLRREPHIS